MYTSTNSSSAPLLHLSKPYCKFLIPLLILLPFPVQSSAAQTPEQDIVDVVSSQPLSNTETVPRLLTGQRIMDQLRDALDVIRIGVPEAARAGLEELRRELHQLLTGGDLDSPLPASYFKDGELWLPVRAQLVQVELDAPDLRPRPSQDSVGQFGNLPAMARRIDWLPVGLSSQQIARVQSLMNTGREEGGRAQQLLQGVLQSVQSNLVLEHRPLIMAYYRVEDALSSLPRWDSDIRDRLRRTAETLNGESGSSELAKRLQIQADQLMPDERGLIALALSLRKEIARVGVPPGQDSGGHNPIKKPKEFAS